MIAIMVVALGLADRFIQRADGASRRFEAMAQIDGNVGQYAVQVADVLLLGREQMTELQAARLNMERAFARLTQVTRQGIAGLSDSPDLQSKLSDLENARRMLELYHSIDLAASRAVVLQRDGKRAEALDIYQRDFEFRLKTEFAALLDSGMQNQREDMAAEREQVQDVRSAVILISTVAALLALSLMVALGLSLAGAVRRPMQVLTSGAEAIAQGDLGRRVVLPGKDEFAALAQRLNAMADTLQAGHADLVTEGERLTAAMDARTKQLSQANDRLRDIDSRRAQFLADVSHELRTPLTILRGEADVALRGRGDAADQRQSLERIQGQAAELSQLLDDLISFARSDAEPQNLVIAETRLDEVIAAAVQEGETLAEPREVTLHLDLDDAAAHVAADFRRLKQALIIGIDNAVKHSPPGGRIDIVSTRDDSQVQVRILDQGPGLADTDRDRVFERFFRGRDESEAGQGLGIGLSIARDIVERHDGTITLDNRSEGGAVLTITLPLYSEARS
jgi:signal transduction histidine kinase